MQYMKVLKSQLLNNIYFSLSFPIALSHFTITPKHKKKKEKITSKI